MAGKTKVVVNPAAGRGKIAQRWNRLQQRLNGTLGPCSVVFTQAPREAEEITRQALRDGFDTIVAVGGDGTVHEVVNGFFENDRPLNREASLGILPNGTGGDWIKALNVPTDLGEAIEILGRRRVRACDLGRLTCQREGESTTQYFANIAEAGFGAAVVQRVDQRRKMLSPALAYFLGLLRTLTVYKNRPVAVHVDGKRVVQAPVNAVIIANGQYFGGGMRIAPAARTDDGLLDVVIIGDISWREAIANLHRLYRGTLSEHPKVQYLRGRRVTLHSEEEILVEADGELLGRAPATFDVRPGALQVIVGGENRIRNRKGGVR